MESTAQPDDKPESASGEHSICPCGDPNCWGRISYPHPFKVNATFEEPDASDLAGYFSVRTTSWEWDSERTDLHDVLSLLWGVSLRVRDAASVHLLAELNPAIDIDSEIYARVLVPRQEGALATLRQRAYLEALSAEAYAADKLVKDVFGVAAAGPDDPRDGGATYRDPPSWVAAVRRRLRLPDIGNWEFNHRYAFGWRAFTSLKRGVSIVNLGAAPAERLREAVAGFKPKVAHLDSAIAYRTDHLVNAVQRSGLQKARSLLQLVEDGATDALVIPMESHFALLGRTTLVALASESGARAFEAARVTAEEQRESEAAVFMADARVEWSDQLDPERFEELVGELLAREPGVHWVRQVGATREPDDGRDFLADWSVPPVGLMTAGVADGVMPPNQRQRVIVQVKLRGRGVARSDLTGIRDTIEHHAAGGMLVVGYPNLTVQLTDHLDRLRRSGRYWMDWWGRPELDRRLRKHPDLVNQYSDLVRLR
ncbi:MAG: restriction endonuclease [Cypionkella sp.]